MNGTLYSLLLMEDAETNDECIMMGAKCAMIEEMTSLTAEQTGITSGILLVHILCLYSGIPDEHCTITFWIDNAEALRRITTDETDDIRLKAYGVKDYGDLKTMRTIHAALPSTVLIKYNKVKSHQDDNTQDLSFEARLNIQADSANL